MDVCKNEGDEINVEMERTNRNTQSELQQSLPVVSLEDGCTAL